MYKYLEKANIGIYNTGKGIQDFFIRYKYVLLISFITGILINAIDIFTFKFGIDSELVPYSNQFLVQRYGSLILHTLFPFLSYNIVSQLTGVISLIFAALLMISRHNISNTGKMLFIMIFISATYFTHLQYFFFQSAYNFIGLLFVVISFRLIENNKNIFTHLLAVCLLFIGISSYQSNFAVFLSVMMLNVMLNFINDKNIKKALILITKSTLILLISLIIYYISIKIISSGMSEYHSNMILWNKNNISLVLLNILNFIFTHDKSIYLYFAVIILYTIFNFNNIKERLFFIFLSFLFILAVYSLNIMMGNQMPLRARITIAILPAFIFLLLYIFKNNNILKGIAVVFALIIILLNTSNNIKLQNTAMLTYEQDKITASKIVDIVYTKYPEIYTGKYKIAFYGRIYPNKHDLKKSNGLFNNGSFFNWGGGNPNRIYAFLRLMGLPEIIQLNRILQYNRNLYYAPDDLKKLIHSIPSYPSPDCAKHYKDTIIVKLSN